MKLFEVAFGNYSVYLVARSEDHAKQQLASMMAACLTRPTHPWVTGSILCDAQHADLSCLYH